jgi:beta-aspartyl-peptidase (threonine type)
VLYNSYGKPVVLVHGGAGEWEDADHALVLAWIHEAVAQAWELLRDGASALDTVERAVWVLEDAPLFDAGVGSFLNSVGEVEMDALITDGSTLRFGAVAAVRHIRHPISLAKLILTETKHRFFVGDGAELLARKFGIELVPNIEFVTDANLKDFRQRLALASEKKHLGTVGAVCLDQQGHVSSATSTGGSRHKPKGRIGDTPVFGAGGYADDRQGAASATGVGEDILCFLLSKLVADKMTDTVDAEEACRLSIGQMAERISSPEVGLIAVDFRGRIGAAHTTPFLPIGWADADGNIQVFMRRSDAAGN